MDYTVSVRFGRPGGAGSDVEVRYDFGPDVAHPDRSPKGTLPAAEVQRLLTESDTHYYLQVPCTSAAQRSAWLEKMGRALYQLLDTDQGRLTGFLAHHSGAIVLAIGVGERMSHLPWELLHDGTGYLVNRPNPVVPIRVLDGHAAPQRPAPRPLRVMFMACAPEDEARPVDHDTEEAMIEDAANEWDLPADIEYKESGRLNQLERRLGLLDGDHHFDVLHLTGHCEVTSQGPTFVTVGSNGGSQPAGAAELREVLAESRPRLLFLSGCRTAASGDLGAAVSLAEQLAETSATTVLGWGRPINDVAATNATKDLYRQLMRGRSPARALAAAYQRLIKDSQPNWHCLRMFSRGGPPPALVTSVDRGDQPWGALRPRTTAAPLRTGQRWTSPRSRPQPRVADTAAPRRPVPELRLARDRRARYRRDREDQPGVQGARSGARRRHLGCP